MSKLPMLFATVLAACTAAAGQPDGEHLTALLNTSYMSSPGHCANIMNAGFTKMGKQRR